MNSTRHEGAGAEQASSFDSANITPQKCEIQAIAGVFASGLKHRPHPADAAPALRLLAPPRERVWCAETAILSLPKETARAVCNWALAEIARHDSATDPLGGDAQALRWTRYLGSPERLARIRREARK